MGVKLPLRSRTKPWSLPELSWKSPTTSPLALMRGQSEIPERYQGRSLSPENAGLNPIFPRRGELSEIRRGRLAGETRCPAVTCRTPSSDTAAPAWRVLSPVGFGDAAVPAVYTAATTTFELSSPPVIPEPSTFLLLLTGILGVSGYGYLRKRRKTTA